MWTRIALLISISSILTAKATDDPTARDLFTNEPESFVSEYYDDDSESQRLWAIDINGNSYTRLGLSGDWTVPSSPLVLSSNFVAHDGTVWGITTSNSIYYRFGINGAWTMISGQMNYIAAAYDGKLWGLYNGAISYRNGIEGTWNSISIPPLNTLQIAVSFDGRIWCVGQPAAITYTSNVWTRFGVYGTWTPVPGLILSTITVDGNGVVWGTDRNNKVWTRNGLNGKWILVEGSLVQISASSSGRVWGVDSSGQVWTRSGVIGVWLGIDNIGLSSNIKRISVAS